MYPQLYHPGNIVGKAEIYLSVISGTHGTPGVAGASAGNIAGELHIYWFNIRKWSVVMSTLKKGLSTLTCTLVVLEPL